MDSKSFSLLSSELLDSYRPLSFTISLKLNLFIPHQYANMKYYGQKKKKGQFQYARCPHKCKKREKRTLLNWTLPQTIKKLVFHLQALFTIPFRFFNQKVRRSGSIINLNKRNNMHYDKSMRFFFVVVVCGSVYMFRKWNEYWGKRKMNDSAKIIPNGHAPVRPFYWTWFDAHFSGWYIA